METKFLSLRHSVELGSRFDDWQVCWLGGWDTHRHFYLGCWSRSLQEAFPGTRAQQKQAQTGNAAGKIPAALKMAGSGKVQTSTE
jgi:hypothetical protein